MINNLKGSHTHAVFSRFIRIMKLINLFFIAGICFANAASSYSQSTLLTLEADNNTLEEVFKMIEKNSEYVFFYSDKAVNLKKKVSINVKDQTIDKILDQVLLQIGNAYSIDDRQVFIGAAAKNKRNTTPLPAVAQVERIDVTGVVQDKAGEPVIGATVVEKDNPTHGTITDLDGRFELRGVPKNAVLQFSFVGMQAKEVAVNGKKIFNVILEPNTVLDEVVVVGYGTQSRATLTTSVSKMDTKALESVPYSNLVTALQGTVSGVRVQSTTGQPGANPRIIVRGGTSINSPDGADPIYIVDGVIRNDIDGINSDDIESMQVLKDAASTAIYGARGSNGVVLITTKTGKAGKTSVTYKYDLTLSQVGKRYDMASARDYIYYSRIGHQIADQRWGFGLNDLYTATGAGTGNDLTANTTYTTQYLTPENKHKLNEGWESMPDPIDPSKTIIFKGTDWQDVLFRTAVSHNHNVNVSGGSETATFNASAGYMKNEGTVITTYYDRLTFNLGGEVKLRPNLKIGGRASYSKYTNNGVNETSIFARAIGQAPTTKYTFEDGTLSPGIKGNGNPAYHLHRNTNKNSDENITFIFDGNWEIIPGLTFAPSFSIWKEALDTYSFTPSYKDGVNNVNTVRPASASYSKWWQTQADAVLTYNKDFTDHHLNVMAGYSYYFKSSYGMSASGDGALTDLIPTLNAVSNYKHMTSNLSKQIMLGYFGRINYNYKQRYLLSVNARYDASSMLGREHKWGFFPGASIGWNVHEEAFWKDMNADAFRLKLRGSYGVNGNITGMGPYTAQGEYAVGEGRYMWVNGIANKVLPNEDLKWEQSKTFDVGVDVGLFDQRVDVIFDYFNRRTDDLITQLPMPLSSGFDVITTNYGSLNNRGIEVEVKVQVMPKRSELQWELGFNASHVKTKIRKLPENGVERNRVGGYYAWNPEINDYDWVGGLQEGGRIGDLFAWKSLGIYATDEEAKADPVVDMMDPYEDKTKYGGDTRWYDADGNGQIDEKDICYMGNTYPKWTGGISSSWSWKNFDLYLRMDYMTGHTIFNEQKIFLCGRWAGNLNIPQEMIDKSWKKQGDIAALPVYIPNEDYNLWRGGDWYGLGMMNSEFYESGNYLCIRELTLGYKLPLTGMMSRIFQNLKVNVTGNNLHYFTKYSGANPEFGGKDSGRYPLPRNVIFGVSATF